MSENILLVFEGWNTRVIELSNDGYEIKMSEGSYTMDDLEKILFLWKQKVWSPQREEE